MNNRERVLAVLNYENYDRLPIAYFFFWDETLKKWFDEGHITQEELVDSLNGSTIVGHKLGFDCRWPFLFEPNFPSYRIGLQPPIEETVLEILPDGAIKVLNSEGVIVIKKEGSSGIPSEVDHILKSRKEWEEFYLPRLQFSEERFKDIPVGINRVPFQNGGLELLKSGEWQEPHGLNIGSLFGVLRDWMGIVGISYIQADDPDLLDEMIHTVGELCYQGVKWLLERGCRFDYCHFWEDICFNSGPLVNPNFFKEKLGPYYRKICGLIRSYGINLIEVDCDGKIDELISTWFENGINIMFPIEVGNENANIRTWREKYGQNLRGAGGMAKRVFAYDYAAIDAEIERLRPLVEIGGFLPLPDHGIPPDAKWENVQYYCEKMKRVFG